MQVNFQLQFNYPNLQQGQFDLNSNKGRARIWLSAPYNH